LSVPAGKMADMSPPVVHPPLARRRIGQHDGEIPPDRCDAGHPLRRPILVGWEPCSCGGHRLYTCACGTDNRFHARPEPRPRCLVVRQGFTEATEVRRADPS